MNKNLHKMSGLDHKCRTCGKALVEHDADMQCPENLQNAIGSKYRPKGPVLDPELWALLLKMEDAAIMLHLVTNPVLLRASDAEVKQRKKEYKDARFALNSYLAERLSKLRGYESVRELRAVPIKLDSL